MGETNNIAESELRWAGLELTNIDTNGIFLITGGTGSLGKEFVKFISQNFTPRKIIIYSRDEYKQGIMAEEFAHIPSIRFLIGDVRDERRLKQAFENVDYVIHAAALKQIPTIEYNPTEAIRTNIDGTVNVIEACLANKVKRAILISTDKACEPINLYGATKLAAEKLFLTANVYCRTRFAAVRYGNVLASRGSIIETFLELKKKNIKVFPITCLTMTRFWITLEQAVKLCWFALNAEENKIFVPRLPSMRIADIAKAIEPSCEFDIIGIRPGEKIHEKMIGQENNNISFVDIDLAAYLTPIPTNYSSDTNNLWLSALELRKCV